MVFDNISKLAGDLSALSEPAKRLLELGLVAINSHGHKVAYGAAAAALAGAIQTTMAISMGVSAVRAAQSLSRISGTLAGIRKQLERINILQSPKLFAEKVWELLDHCITTEKDTNWYFIYHPDTHWTSSFRHLLRSHGTQTRRFIGIFHDLDTAVLFMQGIRVTDAVQNSDERPEFRLLIPTFYHIVIQSPLIFPSNIEPFKIYGEKFDNDYLVYMNLPDVNESNLINIGSYETTLLERWLGGFGTPRVLGTDPSYDESTSEYDAGENHKFQEYTDCTADEDEISSDDEAARGSESQDTDPSYHESTYEYGARRNNEFQYSTDETADEDEMDSGNEDARENECSSASDGSSDGEISGIHEEIGSNN